MTSTPVRRDGRERLAYCGARLGAGTARIDKKTLISLFLVSAAVNMGNVSGFGVVKNTIPRSMENLVLGTVALPNLPNGNPDQLLDDAYERGFRRFDLARTYGMGKSEKIFGKWMEEGVRCGSVDREEITVVTKGGMGNDKYGDPDRELCTRESLRGELMSSLESLRTDYADLYMLHRDDPRIECSDFVDWMNELKQDGYIQRWGVSNWSHDRIKSACSYAEATEQAKPTASSPQLSLAVPKGLVWPSTESLSCPSKIDEISWYKKEGIEIMGWEALAKGFMAVPDLWSEDSIDTAFLNGPDAEIGSNDWRTQRIQRAYCTPENYERRNIANMLAKESGLSLAQVSLLYSLQKGDHVSVLVGAEETKHLDEMAGLREWSLDSEAFNSLTAAAFIPDPSAIPAFETGIPTMMRNSTAEVAYV